MTARNGKTYGRKFQSLGRNRTTAAVTVAPLPLLLPPGGDPVRCRIDATEASIDDLRASSASLVDHTGVVPPSILETGWALLDLSEADGRAGRTASLRELERITGAKRSTIPEALTAAAAIPASEILKRASAAGISAERLTALPRRALLPLAREEDAEVRERMWAAATEAVKGGTDPVKRFRQVLREAASPGGSPGASSVRGVRLVLRVEGVTDPEALARLTEVLRRQFPGATVLAFQREGGSPGEPLKEMVNTVANGVRRPAGRIRRWIAGVVTALAQTRLAGTPSHGTPSEAAPSIRSALRRRSLA